ncbi:MULTISPECIES: hypothetical protein [unclassified Streptomyces]|uniref:hypothetical protein n=1 Tax=unclassified Streptomyces TaxID=2593676 RepID=UPI002ED603BD|nr:hypothetical protein OH827_32670 [Streptomyces sp. NBC_00891]WSY09501.1 hypothetical protein OG464_32675 [Streptomyces sp. NBC_00890]WSZ11121.1 hypothetical protein OG704_32675 [Streptomyces sp. NBC_00869]WSZ21373.1 hypothetical protein OG498_00890 [Streptomyces sp. NBC_00870]
MSTPVHRTPTRQSVLPPARQNRERARTGDPSLISPDHPLLAIQAGLGNGAAVAAVQRADEAARTTEPGNAAPLPAPNSYRARIAAVLDKVKKNLELIDTFVKGVHVPANAGFAQQASATASEGLKHSTGASGTAAASENLVTETAGALLSGMEAVKARKDATKHKAGAAFHTADKKANSKKADAVIGAAGAGNYALGIAKELTKAQMAAHAATASEVSGIGSSVVGAVKGARAATRVGLTARKYHALKGLERHGRTDEGAMARLDLARREAEQAADDAYIALDGHWDREGEDRMARVSRAIDAAWAATGAARDAAADIRRAEDANTMNTVHTYALGKQRNKMGKQAFTAVGESTKAAGGIVTAVAATAGGAGLASNPVGWGLAAGAAGLILGVTAYKAGRAGMKRYDGVRHPERWAAADETPAPPASRPDALKEALKFWKKVENGERQAMARKIYGLAAGAGIEGSGQTSSAMRDSARALLIALKAGPASHGLTPDEWAESLDDPARSAAWVKEIAEQLSSA